MLNLALPIGFYKFFTSLLQAKFHPDSVTERRLQKGISGKVNLSSRKGILIKDLKEVSIKNRVTINDVILSALSASLNKTLDKSGETYNIVIPCNVRFGFYEKREDI